MKLTDEELLTCPPKRKPYKIYDGNGLYAEVPPSGTIRWRFRYRFGGKDKKLCLGLYPAISIEKARNRCVDLKAQLAQGIDPSVERRNFKMQIEMSKFKIKRVAPVDSALDPWDLIAELRRDLTNLIVRVNGNLLGPI